jgi:hypothetical protein
MTASSALDLPPVILPRMFFIARTYDQLASSDPPPEWAQSDLPHLMGLAADLVAAQALSGKIDPSDFEIDEILRAEIELTLDGWADRWRWTIEIAGDTGPQSMRWIETRRSNFSPTAYDCLEALLERATECASNLPASRAESRVVSVRYAAGWPEQDLSNHQRLELQSRARLTVSSLTGNPKDNR